MGAREGRFFSVDPIEDKYPELSSYQFASNTPIGAIDRDGLESEGWETVRAENNIRQEEQRLYKISPKLAEDYDRKGNLTGLMFVGGSLTLGWGADVAASGGFRTLLTNMIKGGGIGAGVNGLISYSKGDNGYEIIKSATSGFFSGAVLGIGWGDQLQVFY